MEIKCKFDHYCFRVFDIDRSVEFYKTALGLTEKRRVPAADGSAIRSYVGEDVTNFTIELTYYTDNNKAFSLGDNSNHIAVHVWENYDEIKKLHRDKGFIYAEFPEKNIHFIHDPDGNKIEVMYVK